MSGTEPESGSPPVFGPAPIDVPAVIENVEVIWICALSSAPADGVPSWSIPAFAPSETSAMSLPWMRTWTFIAEIAALSTCFGTRPGDASTSTPGSCSQSIEDGSRPLRCRSRITNVSVYVSTPAERSAPGCGPSSFDAGGLRRPGDDFRGARHRGGRRRRLLRRRGRGGRAGELRRHGVVAGGALQPEDARGVGQSLRGRGLLAAFAAAVRARVRRAFMWRSCHCSVLRST